jgi:hypothetical protein
VTIYKFEIPGRAEATTRKRNAAQRRNKDGNHPWLNLRKGLSRSSHGWALPTWNLQLILGLTFCPWTIPRRKHVDYGNSDDDKENKVVKPIEEALEEGEGVADMPATKKNESSTDGSSEKSDEIEEKHDVMHQNFIELQSQVRQAQKRLADGKI